MGGSKKQTVGYRYFAGVHMVLCHGPIDAIRKIFVDDKLLWKGINSGGSFLAPATGWFRISGQPNDGATATVGTQTYTFVNGTPVGNQISRSGSNAEIAARLASKINETSSQVTASVSGTTINLSAKVAGTSGNSIVLVVDNGGGVDLPDIPGFTFNRLQRSGATLTGGGGNLNKPDFFGGESREGGISGQCDFLPGDAAQLPNDYLVSRLGSLVPAFRGVASVVLRQMYLSMNPYLKTWGWEATRIHLRDDGATQWRDSLSEIMLTVYDENANPVQFPAMNPAHIIRECLTNRLWGMGYNEAEIDDVSFTAAATLFKAEKMGMCLFWDTQKSIEDFVKIVQQHVDAALYVDRQTGLFTLQPIRSDYVEADLLVLDPSNIDKIEDFKRPVFGELCNSITVNYWDYLRDTTASVTIQDIALAQEQGENAAGDGENNTTVTYEGFADPATASKAAQRDLRALSTPLISCTVYATKVARRLRVGKTFILSWPDYQIASVVMRVTGIAYGNGKTRRVRIQCVQDVFSYPEDAFVSKPPSGWVDPSGPPGPSTYQLAFEAPYYVLVRDSGQSVVDSSIASNKYIGYVGIAASQPASVPAISATAYTDDGSGYEEAGAVEFCAGALLATAVSYLDTSFTIAGIASESLIDGEEWFQIGSELCSVVSKVGSVLTVKRGVLDTIPKEHAAGSAIVFWDQFVTLDPTEYVASDVVNAKVTPANGSGVYALSEAEAMPVALVGRAARPFAPGAFAVNGTYFPTTEFSLPLTITWASRNRLLQTGGTIIGFEDGSITPEAGQTTTLIFKNNVGVTLHTEIGITGESFTLTNDLAPGADDFITVKCFSVRDGLESFDRYNVRVDVLSGIDGGTLLFHMGTSVTPPAGGSITFTMGA